MRDLEEGSYFCFTDQSMAALVWLRAAMLSSVPGMDSPPHLPLYTPPPSIVSKEEDRAGPPVNDWKGALHSDLKGRIIVNFYNQTEKLHDEVFETFLAGNNKEIYQSLKPVSVHYRNKAWIKQIGVHSF